MHADPAHGSSGTGPSQHGPGQHQPGAMRRAGSALAGAARRFGHAVAEINDQQRRLAIIRTSPDNYSVHSSLPPETYSEFLGRTGGALLHEPSAKARRAGRVIR